MKDHKEAVNNIMENIKNEMLWRLENEYQRGYEDGRKDIIKQSDFSYQRGLEDAWECAKKAWSMSETEFHKIFNIEWDFEYMLDNLSATEVVQKIKEYEERQNVKKVYEEKFMPIGKANMEKRREERQIEIKCDTCKYEGSSFSPCIKCKDNSEFEPKEERQTKDTEEDSNIKKEIELLANKLNCTVEVLGEYALQIWEHMRKECE